MPGSSWDNNHLVVLRVVGHMYRPLSTPLKKGCIEVFLIVVQIIWEWTSIQFPNQSTLFLGFTFLLIVYVLPKGIVGRFEQILSKTQRREP